MSDIQRYFTVSSLCSTRKNLAQLQQGLKENDETHYVWIYRLDINLR